MSDDCFSFGDVALPVITTPVFVIASIVITVIYWRNYNYKEKGRSIPKSGIGGGGNNNNDKEVVKKDGKKIKLLGGITLIFYCMGNIILGLSLFIDLFDNCSIGIQLSFPGFTFFIFGFFSLIGLFTLRIIKTFEFTSYAIPIKYIKMIKIFAIIMLIYIALNGLLRGVNILKSPVQGVMMGMVWLLFMIIYIIGILRLFIIKLNFVINDFIKQFGTVSPQQLANLNKSVTMSYEHNPDFGGGLNEQGGSGSGSVSVSGTGGGSVGVGNVDTTNMRYLTRLISDMSKYTILVLFSIISTFISLILVSIFLISLNGGFVQRQKYGIMIVTLDNTINSFFLILQFDFSRLLYKKIFKKLHIKCENRYTNETNKNNNKNNQLQRLQSGELGFKINNNNNDHQATTPPLAVNEVETAQNASNGVNEQPAITTIGQKSVETLNA